MYIISKETILADLKISQEMRINGVTPVDNLFISEFMLCAPSDFVKVYIYALMQCYIGMDFELDSMAKDLSMDCENVTSALMYWVRKGLMKKQGDHYIFESPRSVVYCNGVAKGDALSHYKEFNTALSEIMAGRLLVPADFEMAYDWIEIYGMSRECVLEMVHYAVTEKYKAGIKVSFNTLNKLAASWEDKGIKTAQQAREYINSHNSMTVQAKKILSHLGQFRNPTRDESKLLKKWTIDYGFDTDTILGCCSEMVYSKSPSFALLDTIVEKYHDKGARDISDIEAQKTQDDRLFNMYKEIIGRSGGYGSATKAQKQMIDGLISKGFNEQGLIYICDYLVGTDKKGLSHMEKLALELADMGITDENAVSEELDRRTVELSHVKEFLEAAGFTRRPSLKDIQSYRDYWGVFGSHDIMMKAAELSAGQRNRSEHLAKLLDAWKERKVTSLADAVDIAPQVKKKDADKKEYIKSGASYSNKDLFDIYE